MGVRKDKKQFERQTTGSVFVPGNPPVAGLPHFQQTETTGEHGRRMLAELNQPAASWKTPSMRQLMQALAGDESPGIARRVNALSNSYQQHLRELVDSWIHTGQSAAGDCPASRRPSRSIHELVMRILATHRAVAVPLKDGYVVLPIPSGTLMLDGDDGLAAAELMLAGMLVSPWRLKIAQCVKCEKYFMLKHWERTYRAGTICNRCVPRRTAERSMKAKKGRRVAAEQALYEEAAKLFSSEITPRSGQDQALKEAIARALTAKVAGDAELRLLYPSGRITTKWLAHEKNWMGIEKAVAGSGQGGKGGHRR